MRKQMPKCDGKSETRQSIVRKAIGCCNVRYLSRVYISNSSLTSKLITAPTVTSLRLQTKYVFLCRVVDCLPSPPLTFTCCMTICSTGPCFSASPKKLNPTASLPRLLARLFAFSLIYQLSTSNISPEPTSSRHRDTDSSQQQHDVKCAAPAYASSRDSRHDIRLSLRESQSARRYPHPRRPPLRAPLRSPLLQRIFDDRSAHSPSSLRGISSDGSLSKCGGYIRSIDHTLNATSCVECD
jgi:hypothetical protein